MLSWLVIPFAMPQAMHGFLKTSMYFLGFPSLPRSKRLLLVKHVLLFPCTSPKKIPVFPAMANPPHTCQLNPPDLTSCEKSLLLMVKPSHIPTKKIKKIY